MDVLIRILTLKARWTLRSAGGCGSGPSAVLRIALISTASLVLAAATYRLIHPLGGGLRPELLHPLFLGLYGAWLLAPLLGMGPGGFPDEGALAPFPLGRSRLLVLVLGATSLDGSVLFFMPAAGAAALALPGSAPLVAARLAVVVLFLAHGIVTLRLMTLAFGEILRRRRCRDLSALLVALVCVALYLGLRTLSGAGGGRAGAGLLGTLSGWRTPRAAGLFPPLWCSDALARLGTRGAAPLVALEAASLLLATALLALAARALLGRRLEAARRPLGGPEPTRPGGGGRKRTGEPLLWRAANRLLSDRSAAFAAKELRLLSREPLVRAQLIVQSGFVLLPVLLAAGAPGSGPDPPPFPPPNHVPELVLLGLSFSMVVVQSFLALNLFGLEGSGFAQMAGAPVPRRWLLRHKDLFYLVVFGGSNTAVLAGVCGAFVASGRLSLSSAASLLGTFLPLNWALLALVICAGNVTSILFPVRLSSMGCAGLTLRASGREGLARLALRAAVTAGVLLLMAPFAALILIPHLGLFGIGVWFHALSIPILAAFLLGMHRLSLRIGERLLEGRQEEMLRHLSARGG